MMMKSVLETAPSSRLSRALVAAIFYLLASAPGPVVAQSTHAGGTSSAQAAQTTASCPVPADLIAGFSYPMAHIRYLADDALMGREVGTPGAWCASEYIAAHFRELSLEPIGPGHSYFQPFPVRAGTLLGSENHLGSGGAAYPVEEAWIPFGFSESGSLEAPLVYGGHGISRPGQEDDKYAHIALDGKIVVVEAGDPGSESGRSVQADPHFKATVAAGRRARGIIVLFPEGHPLPPIDMEKRPSTRIPAVAVTGSAAQALRQAAQAGETATLTTSVEPRMAEARNVVALLPGADPTLREEVLIIGAHFDHLGVGGDGSLAPDDFGTVHNGADDNASGTAAMMEIASRLARSPNRPARSVLFIAFTGEEKGLWGSGHYAQNPLLPLEKTVAMFNLDMVGRMEGSRLTVFGTGTAQEWTELLNEVNTALAEPMELGFNPEGYGASDHSTFYGRRIPVLFFNTSTHVDYHRPSDDWQLINEPGLLRVTSLVEDMAREVVGQGDAQVAQVTYAEAPENPHAGGMPTTPTSGDEAGRPRGYGAYLGTIPDMSPIDFGVRITGVREGSPAEQAGLQGGDVIVELEGKEVSDLYAYTYALREHRPGDEVEIIVMRDGERVSLTATLGQRR
jgi:hypothetical protein